MKKTVFALFAISIMVISIVSAEVPDEGYYYSQLSPDAKEVYDLLMEGKESLYSNDKVTIEKTMDQKDTDKYLEEMNTAARAFSKDHPEIFWLRGSWNVEGQGQGSQFVFSLRYSGLSSSWESGERSVPNDEEFLNSQVTNLAKEAQDGRVGKYDQLLYVHDWLTNHNLYNSWAFEIGQGNSADSTPWEAISAFDDDLSPVCEGYAKAFKLTCNQLGIPCVIVTGGNHAWNYVLMDDGNWYAVDVTYDDPAYTVNGVEQNSVISGGEGHTYFLVGSRTFFDDHTEDKEWKYPQLSKTDYNADATVQLAESADSEPMKGITPKADEKNVGNTKEHRFSILPFLVSAIIFVVVGGLLVLIMISRRRAAERRRRNWRGGGFL